MKKFKGWIPDFDKNQFFYGEISVEGSNIVGVRSLDDEGRDFQGGRLYILPGLVDAHVHIESSMLSPSNFAWQVAGFGTVATVSDPHEIANVLGAEGIRYMIEDAGRVPVKIHFTAPSCVPATSMEQSGAVLGSGELEELSREISFVALGEMMNYPAVLAGEEDVLKKINIFRKMDLPVDGHAPELRGEDLSKYIGAGISTDHEATSIEEGREKIMKGMKILIREGSAAKNFESLWPLIEEFPEAVMLCCDDIHPDDLMNRHIDGIIKMGLSRGLNIFNLLRAASINPIEHYKLDVGRLRSGDKADFIIVDDLENFSVKETYVNGECIYSDGEVKFRAGLSQTVNRFSRSKVASRDFEMRGESGNYRVIGAVDGDLYTTSERHMLKSVNGVVMPDNEGDVISIAVVNRYTDSPPSLGWIKNTGLVNGAIASSIAHDSHNIIVMGASSSDIAGAVNLIVENQGGISIFGDGKGDVLPLPVAGLMSLGKAGEVGAKYQELSRQAKALGSSLRAPFMTLSFMALLVIPELKIGDRGLFDVKEFNFVPATSS